VHEAGADPNDTMRYADMALYAAKRRGRDRLVTWSPELLVDLHDLPVQRGVALVESA
jgi:hypothetical protein